MLPNFLLQNTAFLAYTAAPEPAKQNSAIQHGLTTLRANASFHIRIRIRSALDTVPNGGVLVKILCIGLSQPGTLAMALCTVAMVEPTFGGSPP
jgi:hypothetical protein